MHDKQIILIGGGGHCKACIDVIEASGEYNIYGILDSNKQIGAIVGNYPVIGSDADIEFYAESGYWFLITIGQIKTSHIRQNIFNKLKQIGAKIATIVSPTAYIAKDACILEGTIIMHFAMINAQVKIGSNCIINTGSIVEHEVVIGNHCHVSTSAVINGNCRLFNDIFIGSKSVVANSKLIYSNIIVGAGAVVIRDLVLPGVYVGSPAKIKD